MKFLLKNWYIFNRSKNCIKVCYLTVKYTVTLLLVNVHIFIPECDDGEHYSLYTYCKEDGHCVLNPVGKYRHPETQACTPCSAGSTTLLAGYKNCRMHLNMFFKNQKGWQSCFAILYWNSLSSKVNSTRNLKFTENFSVSGEICWMLLTGKMI